LVGEEGALREKGPGCRHRQQDSLWPPGPSLNLGGAAGASLADLRESYLLCVFFAAGKGRRFRQ
jgi:hypothetical protein